MVLVGALIGGVTNSIAIKMLFRPYKAIYIGRWRVPFTPGLIPKRRSELAEQLGKLVVNHLLTAEGLQKKFTDQLFVNEITQWVQKEARLFLRSDRTITLVLEQWFGVKDGKEKLMQQLGLLVDNKISKSIAEMGPMPLQQVIPRNLQGKVDDYLPTLSRLLLDKGKNYINSPEGIERLSNMVDRFLSGRGTFGNMISMFLGNERLVDKIQPEVIKMLNDEGTEELVETFLRQEWDKLKLMKVEQLENYIQMDEVASILKEKLIENIPFNQLDEPINKWTTNLEQPLVEEIVPKAIDLIGQAISKELVHLLQKLKLEDVVKNQVEQFSVARLEDMVLSISRRELKLITYLGALLGGLIGLFQGIFIIFLR